MSRLQHDACFAISFRAVDLVRGLIRQEEERDFVEEMFLIVQQELVRYEAAKDRQEARLRSATSQNNPPTSG
jgi:hypothetical protein